jgi:hypothetical protein
MCETEISPDFTKKFQTALLKDGTTAGPCMALADAQAESAVTINYGVFLEPA